MLCHTRNITLALSACSKHSGPRRLELAYSLMFTLPGTPVIRYGDELGMGDDLRLLERNCARTPMQWSTEPHAGFTKADKPIIPVIDKGPLRL
jgi:maltose alpha-D-glucosyltransferase/alpha-amylase